MNSSSKESVEDSKPQVDSALSASQNEEIAELRDRLKEMEVEKNNLEYTLSRRQNEFITLNESYSTLKAEHARTQSELESMSSEYRRSQAESSSLHNQINSMFLQLTSFLSAPEDQLPAKREAIQQISTFLHPDHIPSRGATITVHCDPDIYRWCRGDPTAITTALRHLMRLCPTPEAVSSLQ